MQRQQRRAFFQKSKKIFIEIWNGNRLSDKRIIRSEYNLIQLR